MKRIILILVLLTSFSFAQFNRFGSLTKEGVATYIMARVNTWTGTNTWSGANTFGGASVNHFNSSYTYGDLGMADNLFHITDETTFIGFTGSDEIEIRCGNIIMLTLDEEGTEDIIILNEQFLDMNIRIAALNVDSALFVHGADGEVLLENKILSTGGIVIGAMVKGDSTTWVDDATHGSGTTTLYIGNNTIDVTAPSDKRLKQNINYGVDYGINDLMSIRVSNYEYKKKPNETKFGISAQDLGSYNIAVQERTDGYLQTDYQKLIPLLIKVVQEQQKQINELNKSWYDRFVDWMDNQ